MYKINDSPSVFRRNLRIKNRVGNHCSSECIKWSRNFTKVMITCGLYIFFVKQVKGFKRILLRQLALEMVDTDGWKIV